MSNAVFPSFPGLKWDVAKIPIWRTLIQTAANGKELRAPLMSFPLWRFTLSYEVLRAASAYAELQSLMGFFNLRNGAYDSFLYTDPDDNSVTDQLIGTGNGTATQYQIVRTYGNFIEPIQNINAITNVKVNGVVKSSPADYTVNSLGVITFTVAPPNGQPVTWTGTFYFRVRFLQDMAEFSQFMKHLWELKKLEFQSVKL